MSATTTTTNVEKPRTITHTVQADALTVLRLGPRGAFEDVLRYGAVRTPLNETDEHPETPTTNPSWWPTNHRRIPNYRPAQLHQQWSSLTSSYGEAFMINLMFMGCRVLLVSRTADRAQRLCLLKHSS